MHEDISKGYVVNSTTPNGSNCNSHSTCMNPIVPYRGFDPHRILCSFIDPCLKEKRGLKRKIHFLSTKDISARSYS